MHSILLIFDLLASLAASGVINYGRSIIEVGIDDAYSLPDMDVVKRGLESRDDPGGFDDQFRDPGDDDGSEDHRRTNCIGDFCPSKYGCMIAPYILDGFYLKQVRTELEQFCDSGTSLVRIPPDKTPLVDWDMSSADFYLCNSMRKPYPPSRD